MRRGGNLVNRAGTGVPRDKDGITSDLRAALERSLNEFFGTSMQIIQFERQPSVYCSSFHLEELTVMLDNGKSFSIVFKDLSWDTLLDGGKRLKPKFIYDPRREIDVYRKVLSQRSFGTAVCYGYEIDEQAGRYWLFLEKVRGTELYQVGEFETWVEVARWLARFHGYFSSNTAALSDDTSLLRYDKTFYREWMRRAQKFYSKDANAEAEAKQLEWLAGGYDAVVERLMNMPHTFIHGEFYASNVLVNRDAGQERVCPVDWERSGVGPCLIDLAALAGGWNHDKRAALADAYYHALPERARWFANVEDFSAAFKYCQLYLAIQWLGWFGRRNSFGPHEQDWLGEAVSLAESLGL